MSRTGAIRLGLVVVALVAAMGFGEVWVRRALHPVWSDKGARAGWSRFEYTHLNRLNLDCMIQESLELHPFLGWVLGPKEGCQGLKRNNRNFWDRRDLPLERDREYFSILLSGGSVASQVAYGPVGDAGGVSWLEEALNSRYTSPNGRPFRVFSGAMTGWRTPLPFAVLTLLGDRVDAFVTLDGYNEFVSVQRDAPVEMPDTGTLLYLLERRRTFFVASLSALRSYRAFVSNTRILQDSHLLLHLFERALVGMTGNSSGNFFWTEEQRLEFGFPEAWDHARIEATNVARWKKNLRLVDGTARALGLKRAHFIQPVPMVDKPLSDWEQAHVALQPMAWEKYRTLIVEPALELTQEGLAVFSLLGVFHGIRETLYEDLIHCRYVESTAGSAPKVADNPGYRLMGEAMADRLAVAWKLKPRGQRHGS